MNIVLRHLLLMFPIIVYWVLMFTNGVVYLEGRFADEVSWFTTGFCLLTLFLTIKLLITKQKQRYFLISFMASIPLLLLAIFHIYNFRHLLSLGSLSGVFSF